MRRTKPEMQAIKDGIYELCARYQPMTVRQAAWEALVQLRTPEANIRVDLLLIWPLLGALTLYGLIRCAIAVRR